MKQYIKPTSIEIALQTEGSLMGLSGVNDHKFYGDPAEDQDYGQQFSNKKGWGSENWNDLDE